jgi:dipeptidyl aminopeptidase/acylaminoacyl peptidase
MLVSLDAEWGREVPSGPAWAPSGDRIAFLWPRQGKKQVWLWRLEDGGLAPLTSAPFCATNGRRSIIDRTMTDRPRWSPDGLVLCCAGRDDEDTHTAVWLLGLEGTRRRLTEPEPGDHRNPAWSPDGRRIAFVSRRDGRDQLWLANLKDSRALQLVWDRWDNFDPRWSPDGRWIAFTSQRSDAGPLLTQCALLDMTNGKVQVVTEGGHTHSRFGRWSPDGSALLFLSDRSGFDEVWRLDLRSGRQEQLTRSTGQDKHGEFAVSPTGVLAYVQVRRACHDLEVLAPGGNPRRLGTGDGVHRWPAWSADGRRVVAFAEAPTAPPELRVYDAATGETLQATACSAPHRSEARVSLVSFPTFDARDIDGVLCEPGDTTSRRTRAAIVNIHGGPNDQYTFDYDPYVQRLAEDGFVILSPNCRGSTGYGRAFMELNVGDWGGGDYRDWLAAAAWLANRPDVDPSRIAIWGRSYGGSATLTALGRAPSVFRCGVCHFGPCDLTRYFQQTIRSELLVHFLGLPWLNQEAYRTDSPMTYIDGIRAPLLVLHGARDPGVPPSESERLVERLRANGRDVEYVCYPDEPHGFDRPEHRDDAADRIRAFFGRHLASDATR